MHINERGVNVTPQQRSTAPLLKQYVCHLSISLKSPQVARTKDRPIANGQLSKSNAMLFLGGQLSVSLAILLSLNSYRYSNYGDISELRRLH